jgi:DNA repair protein RadD
VFLSRFGPLNVTSASYTLCPHVAIALYDYQESCIAGLRAAYRSGKRAPLLVAPTGSGKTVMFSYMAAEVFRRGNRATILVHRQELMDQVSDTLSAFAVRHGLVSAGRNDRNSQNIQVASVFTLVRRVHHYFEPTLLIIDEAHHAINDSTWGKIIAAYPNARILGVTATPVRLSGEGLGDIFDTIVMGPSTQELIDKGRLSPVQVFAPPTIKLVGVHSRGGDYVKSELETFVNHARVTGDAIAHYQRLTPGQRAVVFCVSIKHAEAITAGAQKAGISAVKIDGKMDKGVRRGIIQDFRTGRIKWLVSVDLISEGFDVPDIEVGISLRPTQSVGLWLQQCGRIIRAFPGKSRATILDHSGNSLRHGLPTETRDWNLSGSISSAGGSKEPGVRVCPSCFSAQRSGSITCAHCGAAFPVESRTVATAKGDLEEITQEKIEAIRARQTQGQTQTLEELVKLGLMRGYAPGKARAWAGYVMAGRQKKQVVGR